MMADGDEPPPSYESVVYRSKLLGCKDFWPVCLTPNVYIARDGQFQSFHMVFQTAKQWLESNPHYEPLTCETVEKRVKHPSTIYSGDMEAKSTRNPARIKGLRLWYKANNSGRPCILDYVNVTPKSRNKADAKNPMFESLATMVDSVNSRFREQPLNGRIITIETVTLNVDRWLWKEKNGGIDVLSSCWQDNEGFCKLHTLRIFYAVGTPANELIGLADFVPDGQAGYTFSKPQYSSFPAVTRKASLWIKQAQGIRVTKLQTIDTCCTGERLDTLNSFEYKVEDKYRVHFLRVMYTKPISTAESLAPPKVITYPYCFAPAKTNSGYGPLEQQQDTIARIQSWVRAADATVLCAETVTLSGNSCMEEPSRQERTVYSGDWTTDSEGGPESSVNQAYIFRLYMVGNYRIPAQSELPQPVKRAQPPNDSCTVI